MEFLIGVLLVVIAYGLYSIFKDLKSADINNDGKVDDRT